MAERARAVWTEGEARPRCSCHSEPMENVRGANDARGPSWTCNVKRKAKERAAYRENMRDPEWAEQERNRNREKMRRRRLDPAVLALEAARGRARRATPQGAKAAREAKARYRASPKGRSYQARRIRMSAGGISFEIGVAPTLESAARLRQKIKEEAPT